MPTAKFPWLKTVMATVVTVSVIFTPVVQALSIGGGSNSDPIIQWSSASPSQFNPSNGERVRINWSLSGAPAIVEVFIYNGHPNYGGYIVRNLVGPTNFDYNGSPVTPSYWDGKIGGNVAPDGP